MAGRMFDIAFNLMARTGSSFSSTFSAASEQMMRLNTSVSALKAETKELDQQQKKGLITAEQYGAAYSKVSAQLAKAEKAQQSFAKAQALQDKVKAGRSNARQSMVGAIETAAVIGAPTVVAMQFDSAMTGVAKQVEGARSETGELTAVFSQAREKIMQASKDMMIMPDAMAKAFTMAAKSGVKGMENIDRFARMGNMMGTAFEASADEITEQFAKIGSARGINLATKDGIDRLEALADAVNYLDDQSNASGSDIISVMKRISGTATSLMPTLSDTTLAGMATAMLHMGETSETAGTALNSLFTKVAAAPTQAKSFHSALAQVGLTAEELQNGALQDGEGAIMNLFERIGQLDAAAKNNVLAELFGSEHVDTLSKISGNYEQFVEVIKMGKSEAAKGSMAKEFAIQSQTAARQLEGLKATAARTAVTFMSVLLPDIKAVANAISAAGDWFSTLSTQHSSLSSLAVRLGAAFLAGSVALSALSYAGWAVISPFVNMYAWVSKTIIAYNAAAVSAGRLTLSQRASAAATWLWTGAQWLWNAAIAAGQGLLSVGRLVAYHAMTGVISVATKAWTAAQWLWNAAMMANPIGLVVVGVAGLIAAGYALVLNWDTVKTWFAQLWNDPSAALQSFVDGIRAKFGPVITWLEEKWSFVKSMFGGGAAGMSASAPSVMAEIPAYASGTIATSPHVGLIAEAGDEAIIPLDGSPRSTALWAEAGSRMGIGGGSSGSSVVVNYNPVINVTGGADADATLQAVRKENDTFAERLQSILNQERRVSFA